MPCCSDHMKGPETQFATTTTAFFSPRRGGRSPCPRSAAGAGLGPSSSIRSTGLVYAVHQPTMLGGFFIFATLAFIGQLLFYAAFRRAVPGGKLPVYAAPCAVSSRRSCSGPRPSEKSRSCCSFWASPPTD